MGTGKGLGRRPAHPAVAESIRRRRTPSVAVERELLAAAEAVLVRDGPRGLTVRAVAAEAGIAPMGVYNRLGGKDGLVNALRVRGFDRLRVAIETSMESASESDARARMAACSLQYREFALANPHFYAIMFNKPVPRERGSQEVEEHARAVFAALARAVEMGIAAGVIAVGDATEAAQRFWSALHGAVALDLNGLVLTHDSQATYRSFFQTLIRGMAPAADQIGVDATGARLKGNA